MPLHCLICSYDNVDGSVFCVACGKPLAQTSPSGSISSPPLSRTSSFGPISSPPPDKTSSLESAGQMSQTKPSSQSLASSTQQIAPMGTVPVRSGEEELITLRAFAGYGIPVMHHSWLLNGDAAKANDLFSAVTDIMRQRTILGLKINTKILRERGFQTEERYYLIVQRGVTTVFIYIAPAGHDLYISRATAILPAIDAFRVINLIICIVAALFAPGILSGLAASSGGASPALYLLASFFSIFISLPIWLYLLWFLYRSFRYWLREKDFWVYLRARDLNDFQLDDIMVLEHATDETVLSAAKQLNLDASKIVSPTQGYRPERHIRII